MADVEELIADTVGISSSSALNGSSEPSSPSIPGDSALNSTLSSSTPDGSMCKTRQPGNQPSPQPHILDVLIPYLPRSELLLLRTACWDFRNRIDKHFCAHMIIRDDASAEAWWYTTELMRAPSGRIPCFMPLPRGSWLDPDDYKCASEVKRQRRRNFGLLRSIKTLDLELSLDMSTFLGGLIRDKLPNQVDTLRLILDRNYCFVNLYDMNARNLVVFFRWPPVHAPLATCEPRPWQRFSYSGVADKVVIHLTYGDGALADIGTRFFMPRAHVETVLVLHPSWDLGHELPRREPLKAAGRHREQWIGHPRARLPSPHATHETREVTNFVLERIYEEEDAPITVVNMLNIEPRLWGLPDHWGTDSMKARVFDTIAERQYRKAYRFAHDPAVAENNVTFLNGKEYMARLSPAELEREGVLELEPGERVNFLPGRWKPRREKKKRRRPAAPIMSPTPTAQYAVAPAAVLDLPTYVHLADSIIEYADSEALAVLRQTCRAFRDRIDPLLFNHMIITNFKATGDREAGIMFSSPRGVLPAFPRDGWSTYNTRALPEFDRDQRAHYAYLCSLVRVLDYSEGYHEGLGTLVSSFSNVRVIRIATSDTYDCGNPFPATTVVVYTTPRSPTYHGTGGEFIPRLCRKVVYHALYSSGQRLCGIPSLREESFNRTLKEIVFVFTPFHEVMHPEHYEGPRYCPEDDDCDPIEPDERRRELVSQLAIALLPGVRIVRLVNMDTLPREWLGFPADWAFEEVKSTLVGELREALDERGNDFGWVPWDQDDDDDDQIREPETDAERDEFVQFAIERIVWMTGHEYYVTIPAEDVVAECTIELVPGERHWLLPEVELGLVRRPETAELIELDDVPPCPDHDKIDMEQLMHFDRWCVETDYGESDGESMGDCLEELFIDLGPGLPASVAPLDFELLGMAARLCDDSDVEDYALDKLFVDVPPTDYTTFNAAQDELLHLLDRLCDEEPDIDYRLDALFADPPPVSREAMYAADMELMGLLDRYAEDVFEDKGYRLDKLFDLARVVRGVC